MFVEGNMTNPRKEQIRDLHLTCKTCFKYFASKTDCKNHTKRMHTNKDVKVGCSICHGKFKTRTALKSHIKNTHVEHMEEENICPTCGSKYGYERDLRRHCMRKVHDFPKSKLNIKGDKESCIACGKFVVNMKCHIEMRHKDKNKLFPCEKCSDTFDRKDNLRRHESLVHKISDTNCAAAAKLLKIHTNKGNVNSLIKHLMMYENWMTTCFSKIALKIYVDIDKLHNLTKHIQMSI